jgi:major vault protein
VSEGEVERGLKGAARSAVERNRMLLGDSDVKGLASNRYAAASTMSFMESSQVSKDQQLVGEEFSRGSTYTAPRTITLDTKYQGAPIIDIWPGYAVLVVSKDPNAPIRRRVVKGPETILLDYHEVLEVMSFSTGKPKNTDMLERSVYLRVEHNKVSDKVTVETSDHVQVELSLSYKVNFTGDTMKWFVVENYVKYLCDHARSILKGAVRKIKVEDFYANSTDIIRDTLLGKSIEGKRPGLVFHENGMQMDDLEVLGAVITDSSIQNLLVEAQRSAVRINVELANLARGLEVTKKKEAIVQEETAVRAATAKSKAEIEMMLAEAALSLALAKFGNRLKELEQEKRIHTEAEVLLDIKAGANLVREKAEKEQNLALNRAAQELAIVKLKADVDAVVERFKAAQGGFSEALLALSRNETLVKVAESWSIQRVIGGDSVSEALSKVFAGSPIEGLVKKMLANGQPQGSAPGQLPVPQPPPRA